MFKFKSKVLLFKDLISISVSPISDVIEDFPKPVMECNMTANLQKSKAYSNFLTHIFLKLKGTQQWSCNIIGASP